jgi:glycosyltransferase involved in cell wall biosynthesis
MLYYIISTMKIAIVVDSLVEFGGAERVLKALLEIFPRAEIFTSVVDEEFNKKQFSAMRVKKIFIPQRFFARHTSLFQAISPLLWRLIDLREYNIVIAISGHMMSNLVNPRGATYIQYVLTPPKNIYSIESKTNLQTIVPYHIYIRKIYKQSLRTTPYIVTLSYHMRDVLRTLFGVNASVIYPPVTIPVRSARNHRGTYYLVISRLDRSKSIELAIKACNALQEKLIIVGASNEPAYERHLHHIAGSTIRFAGFQPSERLGQYYFGAKAFLFTPKNEDFGIAPVEAMAHGVPVIGYYGAGLKESVVEGETGHFFYQHSVRAVIRAIRTFESTRFSVDTLYQRASMFSEKKFKHNIIRYVTGAITERGKQ